MVSRIFDGGYYKEGLYFIFVGGFRPYRTSFFHTGVQLVPHSILLSYTGFWATYFDAHYLVHICIWGIVIIGPVGRTLIIGFG